MTNESDYQFCVLYDKGKQGLSAEMISSLQEVCCFIQSRNPCPVIRVRPCLPLKDMFLLYKISKSGEFREIFLVRYLSDDLKPFLNLLYKPRSLLELLYKHYFG